MKSYIAMVLNASKKPIGKHIVYEIGEGTLKIIYTIINGQTYFGSPAKWEERNEGA